MKNTTYCKPELAAGTTYCKQQAIPHARGRRISNAIKEYKRRFIDGSNNGAFLVSDLHDIDNISGDKYDLINNALMAGYMIGYRKGRRDARA